MVEIKYQQDTIDTGDPCYKVRKEGSYLHLVHDKSNDKLVISHVSSKKKGDFSEMMNAVTQELETNQVLFTMVINENLINVLEGFEKDTIYWDRLGEEMTVLRGEWESDFSRQN